tara:strand:- start:33 stop:482 length:450 start_codon:yes stop_codon:yes gene_type:complete
MEIQGYPNYLIYPDGRVFTKKRNKFLKPGGNGDGYEIFKLYEGHNIHKTITCHRLVAVHYIPNPENLKEVDHLNRIRDDNRVENLRWVTSKENNNNKGFQINKSVNFKYISRQDGGYRFQRKDCKKKYSKNLSKVLCYSFFYLLAHKCL